MATCAVTGKKVLFGNNVSHAKNRTKRCFRPNINKHRFYSEVENRWITLRVSKKGLRIIDKEGFDEVWRKINNKVCSKNGKEKD